MQCTHHWTVTSECPMCLRIKLDAAINALASVSLATRNNTAPAHVILGGIGRRVGEALRLLRKGRIEVHAANEPRRVFDSIPDAIAYASGKLYMGEQTKEEAAAALAAGRHFSFAYGFVDCTMFPQVEQ